MATGPFSSVMLIAANGLIDNQALAPAGNISIAIADYNATTVASDFDQILSNAIALGNNFSPSTLTSLRTLGSNTIPALTDSIPTAYQSELGTATTLANLIVNQANLIMGNGDLSKFAQTYGSAQGYRFNANQMINSVQNTESVDATFVDMDSITTGGLSLVSNDLLVFGSDLVRLGQVIALNDLAYLGFPSALVRQVLNVGGLLPVLDAQLRFFGITDKDLQTIVSNPAGIAGTVELALYRALQEVKGNDLTEVLFLLDVTTPNLVTMADLLNPVRILPSSYQTLVLLLPQGLQPVYIGGVVNSNVQAVIIQEPAYQALEKIIPADQALVMRAFSRSLFQIKNVINLSLPELSRSASVIESNQGLTDITSLDTAIPSSVVTGIISTLTPNAVVQTATGANNTFTLYDFIGTAAGYPHVDALGNVTFTIDNMEVAGSLDDLITGNTAAFVVMIDVLDGVYGDPIAGNISGLPAPFNSGEPYANADVAFSTSLIPETANIIGNIANTYTANASTLNTNWNSMAQQIVRETINLAAAQIDFAEQQGNSQPSTIGLATNLHSIGTDVSPNGPNTFFTAVANTTNQGGQAVIASLREGRNIQALERASIGVDTQLSAD